MITDTAERTASPPRRRGHRPHLRRISAILAVLVVGFSVVSGVSYVRALTAPGYATFADKTSAWLRDNGAGGLVDRVESWWYTRHTPSRTPADPRQFTGGLHAGSLTAGGTGLQHQLPTLPTPVGSDRSPGWHPAAENSQGSPVVYTSQFEPDPVFPGVVAGVAIIDAATTAAHLVLGLSEPGHTATAGEVPAADISHLAATFNSGFRFRDITGGVIDSGHTVRPMRIGQATAAIDIHGRLSVGQWGRDLGPGTSLVAARQNLALIVDRGRVQPVTGHSDNRWGGTHLQYQYTWRSGLGIDRNGNLIYIAGNHLDLQALATGLLDAGAVRAMELDMHSGMTVFSSWQHAGGDDTAKLLMPGMNGPAARYLTPDRRDFFYLTTP